MFRFTQRRFLRTTIKGFAYQPDRSYHIFKENCIFSEPTVIEIDFNSRKEDENQKPILTHKESILWVRNAQRAHNGFKQLNTTYYNFPDPSSLSLRERAKLEKE